MIAEEEKIIRWLKLTFLFLFTMLTLITLKTEVTIVMLMFYMAFVKEYK